MSENTWEAIGAIAGVLTLILSIAFEWERFVELYTSFRARSISLVEATKRAITLVAKRAWRPVLVILCILLLGSWIRSNLLVQPLQPLSSWTLFQYAFAIVQAVPLTLLVYILLVEPWRQARRPKQPKEVAIKWSKSGNLFWAGHDLMRAVLELSSDNISSEDIVEILQQSLRHVQELGFDDPSIESKLAGLTAGAGSTLEQKWIWTEWQDSYKEKLRSLIGKIGDNVSGDQKRRVGFFDSGPKGDESKYASYSFECDFRCGLNDAWTIPSGWLPQVDNERGVLLVHHDDLRKVLLLEELPLFMNGLIECEVYLERGALFDVMFRGIFDDIEQPRGLDNEFYMARFDTRGGDQLDCILIKPKGSVDWHKRDRGEHHSPYGQWLEMRVVADGHRISLYRDGNPVSKIQTDDAKVTTGRIGLFAEKATVYVREIHISPKFPWNA